MDLLIAVVNYRTAELTIDLLASLAPELEGLPGSRVVVVDNASGDGSPERIAAGIRARSLGERVTLVAAPENGGFSYGNNQAIGPALGGTDRPRYVWLLNPDTVVTPGALKSMLAFMDLRPEIGIAGTRVANADGSHRPSAFRFLTPLTEFEGTIRLGPVTRLLSNHVVALPVSEEPSPVDWVSGASMIIRQEVFDAVGVMDEEYFLYFEELDFCLRARRAGFACWYVPAATVVHYAGQSTGVTGSAAHLRRRPAYWFDSRRRYFVKNFGRKTAALADLGWAVGCLLQRGTQLFRSEPAGDPPHLLRDFITHSARAWTKTKSIH